MVRWKFALAIGATWTSIACTATLAEPGEVEAPEPDTVASATPVTPTEPAPAAAPDVVDLLVDEGPTPPDRACNPELARRARVEPVDDPADPGSGRIVTRRRDGTWVGLPLQHTSFDTLVVGTVAETTVTQTFVNPLKTPIEAVYTFPLPHDGAVDDYWIRVDDRAVHGVIKRREDAQQAYEDAKAEGRTAGLLEQERPNVFTQSLANLPAGRKVEVTMHLVQPLRPDAGTYELVLPTVVGPRYIPGAPTTPGDGTGMVAATTSVPDAGRITPPVLPPTIDSCGDLSVEVAIETGRRLRRVRSPGHHVAVDEGAKVTRVRLDDTKARLNRDFVLRWRAAAAEPLATLIADPDPKGGGYFTLTVEPPLAQTDPSHGQEFVFLVDASGSMAGEPMELSKATMRRFVQGMTPADAFSIIRFSEAASGLGETLLPGTKANRERALEYIDALEGQGGTEMTAGISAAFAMPRDPGRTRYVILLTDGYIGNEDEIFELVDREIGDTRMFGLGVGSSVNRYLLDGVAKMGHGSVAYVDLGEPAKPVVDRLYGKLRHPALEGLAIDWGDLTVDDAASGALPDLFAGEPVVVFGRYEGELEADVTVRGRRAGADVTIPVALSRASRQDVPGIASMWARARIDALTLDGSLLRAPRSVRERVEKEVVALSLEHRVLTEYTAFVAVDTESRVDGHGESTTVVQGVELAAGMAHAFTWGQVAAPIGESGESGYGSGSGSGYGSGSGAGFGGRGVRAPRVRAAQATVRGSLDRGIIRRIVRAHVQEVRGCYNRALARDPSVKGRVAIRFVIDEHGLVAVATVDDDETGDEVLGQCIADAVQGWKFPVGAHTGKAVVTYPFVLTPKADPRDRPRPHRP